MDGKLIKELIQDEATEALLNNRNIACIEIGRDLLGAYNRHMMSDTSVVLHGNPTSSRQYYWCSQFVELVMVDLDGHFAVVYA